jgi:hypothetical protein
MVGQEDLERPTAAEEAMGEASAVCSSRSVVAAGMAVLAETRR